MSIYELGKCLIANMLALKRMVNNLHITIYGRNVRVKQSFFFGKQKSNCIPCILLKR